MAHMGAVRKHTTIPLKTYVVIVTHFNTAEVDKVDSIDPLTGAGMFAELRLKCILIK